MKLILDKNQEKNIEFGPNKNLEMDLLEESNVEQKQNNGKDTKSNYCPNVSFYKKFFKSLFDFTSFTFHRIRLSLTRFGRNLICNISQKNDNQNQSSCNLGTSIGSPKITHFSNSFSNQTVNSKKSIPRVMFQINTANSHRVLGKVIFGPINATTNQAAEILTDNPDNAFSQGFVNNFSIKSNLAERSNFVKQIPQDFAVELNRLIQLEMDGAVG